MADDNKVVDMIEEKIRATTRVLQENPHNPSTQFLGDVGSRHYWIAWNHLWEFFQR